MNMKQEQLTPKMARRRKFLLVLPLLILPFLTMFFWASGGGKPNPATSGLLSKKGFNTSLPDAKINDGHSLNKMSYYDQAALDSVKLREQIKGDPYYRQLRDTDTLNKKSPMLWDAMANDSLANYNRSSVNANNPKASEAQVYKKLVQLKTAINQPSAAMPLKSSTAIDNADNGETRTRLLGLNSQAAEDPEMTQMGDMLEKVLDIQHPDRVNEQMRIRSEKNAGQVFSVSVNHHKNPIGLFTGNSSDTAVYSNKSNGFYSLENGVPAMAINAITAVVHKNETVVNGSIIKLRLTAPVFVDGVMIPKNNFVFGVATLNGERLTIKINSIRYEQSLFPVALSVYDMDGLEGIEIPGAISRDVAKSSAASSLQNIGLTTYDPSLGAQAAGAGIEAAKTLFTRKVKLIKVTVKSGYQVLLKDDKAKDNKF